ncbi:MAG: hypothetical protein II247_02230 [Lachnospiraceae bacterium]|nr:hypothetical protein [Lachnospiraceae bacterium]
MRFDEFVEAVMDGIREWLPENLQKAEISLQTCVKNNDVRLTGLVIRSAESNIAPTIYLEKFYEQYMEGEPINDILREIARIREENDVKNEFDTKMVTKLELCRNKIMPRLVGAGLNKELLKQRPHILIEDLAVVFCVNLECSADGTASIPISNQMAETWGTTADDLYQIAVDNMKQSKIGLFQSMSTVMKEMMYPDLLAKCDGDTEMAERMCKEMMPPEDRMYILTNIYKVNGASMLLDSDMMQKVMEEVGSDFFILPSSIHEVLIVPADSGMQSSDLETMVREVNDTEVSDTEILSYHVYRYSMENGIQIA